MMSFARGSPFRSLLALVSVLALLVLAQIGPSNATPPDEVAVSTDVVQVMPTIAPLEFSVLGDVAADSSPAIPAPRVTSFDAAPSADPLAPVGWRSPVSPATAAPERNDARPPNRQRT